MRPVLLDVQDVYAGYHDFDILKGVSLRVHESEIVCVIGPNGAGKSTIFKVMYGLLSVRLGRVTFDGQDVTRLRPQEMLKRGVAFVPQLRSVFPQMTVIENLEMGMFLELDQKRVRQRIKDIFELFPRLHERAHQKAGTMSGGEQRMLEIGRALMLEPKLLLMDEPSAGLSPYNTQIIFQKIQELNQQLGLTVLMIEQNAWQGLGISHRGYVLELGMNSHEGAAQMLIGNQDIRRAFLGAH